MAEKYFIVYMYMYMYIFFIHIFIYSSGHFGKGNGNLFHYSYLENPMDKGPWWVANSWTELSTHTHTHTHTHWTLRLPPCPGSCKQCCYEHWGPWMLSYYGFLQIYTQEWGPFLWTSIVFSIVVVSNCISTNSVGGLLSSTSSPASIAWRLLDDGHPDS